MSQKKKTICSAVGFLCIAAVIVCAGELVPRTSMFRTVLQLGAIYALLAVSMNLCNGFTGLFSLGQAGFMTLGAYTYAIFTIPTAARPGVYYLYGVADWLANLHLPIIAALLAAGVVGALFAALTVLLAPISYGNLQFRISEALCVLPVFFPYTSVGLFLGCALANMISAAGILDVVFGSLATLCAGLCAAACGREARRTGAMPSAAMRVLACLSPVVWNGVVIGAVLAWSFARDAFWQSFLLFGAEVALGEAGVLFLLGMPLISLIPRIFHLERKNAA